MRVFHSTEFAIDAGDEPRQGFARSQETAQFDQLRLERLRPFKCCLTAKDYSLLESRLTELRARNTDPARLLARFMRAKLADAEVVLPGDVAATVATTNSRIVYAVDEGAPSVAVLVHWEHTVARDFTLPITTLLGATLLGMREGQQAPLLLGDGGIGKVFLKEVAFQPEAARRTAGQHMTNLEP